MQSRKSYSREILQLAIPVSLGQAGHILVGIADSVMVGNIGGPGGEEGKIALAAASLANGLFAILLVFGMGLAYGITPPVANASGEGNENKLKSILLHGLVLCLFSGLILFGVLSTLSPLLSEMGQPERVVSEAIPYFNVLLLSMVPLMIFMAYKQFAEGLSFTLQATVISILSNLINVGLNYLLIYGKGGFPEMGLMGAGWASFYSRVLMAVMMALTISYHRKLRIYRPELSIKSIHWKEIRNLLKIGVPIGFQLTFEVSAFALAAVMIGWLGAEQLAAHQIALSLAAVTYMLASGIGSAATVKVGQYLGTGNNTGLRLSALSAGKIVIIFMIAAGIFFIIFRNNLPWLFNKDESVITLASGLLIIAAFFQVSDGLQVVAQGALRGLSDVKMPTYIAFLSYFVVGLPVAYIFGFLLEYGAVGVWWGLLIGLSTSAVLQIVRFIRLSRNNV